MTAQITAAELIERFGLAPLPVEGLWFRQTWRSTTVMESGRPAGTAIMALVTPETVSVMHRLPTDELWHFYLGDPIEVLLLHPGGASERVTLGHRLDRGDEVQLVVPAGSWMGARLCPGGSVALFGTTMAPGFVSEDYEGGDRDALVAGWPQQAPLIEALTRPDGELRMPHGL